MIYHDSHMDWKTGENSGHLNRLEKSGNFVQNTGKMREFYPKYWKSDGILPRILEKWGNFSQFLFVK